MLPTISVRADPSRCLHPGSRCDPAKKPLDFHAHQSVHGAAPKLAARLELNDTTGF